MNRRGQSAFEMTAIMAVVFLLSGAAFTALKGAEFDAYESTRRMAADVAGDFGRAGSRYLRDLTVGAAADKARTAAEPPARSALAPAADPLSDLRKSL